MQNILSRYPGTLPFDESYIHLFFGRDTDIQKLTRFVTLEKLIVLFGKSGLGKSSLLNAGVLPVLEKEGVMYFKTRFLSSEKLSPLEMLIQRLTEKEKTLHPLLEKLYAQITDSQTLTSLILWFRVKNVQLFHPKAKSFLLVFDQFEELFNFETVQISAFKTQLAEILSLQMPQRLLDTLMTETVMNLFAPDELDELLSELKLKVILSLRSDKISLLNQLADTIPGILQKRYELEPLSEQQARDAILKPAKLESNQQLSINTQPFSYNDNALKTIISYLSKDGKERIEAFQLQIICKYCEDLKISNIQTQHLGNLQDVFDNYYINQLSKIEIPQERTKIQILIENSLLFADRRIPVHEEIITGYHQIPKPLLDKFAAEARIIRSEQSTTGGYVYEISHDTLVAPILKSKKVREDEEKRLKDQQERIENERKQQQKLKRLLAIVVVSVLLAVGAVVLSIYAFNQKSKAQEAENKAKKLLVELEEKQKQEKKLNFDKYISEARSAESAKDYLKAIEQYTIAKDFSTDTTEINTKIAEIRQIAGKRLQYEELLRKAELLLNQNNDDALLQVRSIYQQALELNIENSTVKTKQGELNLKINELVADFKSKALKLIDAELYNEAKVFLNRAKTLKPTDTEIDRLLNNCK